MIFKGETTANTKPTPYELGVRFYIEGRLYNPYAPDTAAFTEFNRGRLDAEANRGQSIPTEQPRERRADMLSSSSLARDAQLRRTQFHAN